MPLCHMWKKIIKISSEIIKFVYSQGKYEDDILLKREVEKIIIDILNIFSCFSHSFAVLTDYFAHASFCIFQSSFSLYLTILTQSCHSAFKVIFSF